MRGWVHKCAHMCTCVRAQVCAHMCTHVHTCAHVCTIVHICADMFTSVHKGVCTSVHKCAQVCTCVLTAVHSCAKSCTIVHAPGCAQLCTQPTSHSNFTAFARLCVHNCAFCRRVQFVKLPMCPLFVLQCIGRRSPSNCHLIIRHFHSYVVLCLCRR